MPLPKDKVRALQLSLEGLLKLRKEDPERFFEILTGLTSRRESEIATIAVENMTAALKTVEAGMRQLHELATAHTTVGV